jgi:hypothetical protein
MTFRDGQEDDPDEALRAAGATTMHFAPTVPNVTTRNRDTPLSALAYVWRCSSKIPPREWLMGTTAICGYITLLVAPGGVGKSTLAVMMCLAVATGRQLLGEQVFQRAPVWLLNLEDSREEMERRLAAAMMHHNITPEEIEGRLFLHSGRDRPVTMATAASHRGAADGWISYPDKDAIAAEVRQHGIRLMVVDPFINSHELDENNNPQMNAAMRAWAEVASETNCAIMLVHHTRKTSTGPGDAEGARGAKSLVDAARVVLTLTAMTLEEAESYEIPTEDRSSYIRLDDAKQNMAKAKEPRWFHLESVELGNGNIIYPEGDKVQAIETWRPPGLFEKFSNHELNNVLDLIARGIDESRSYGASKRGKSERWVGELLMEKLHCTEEKAERIIAAWLKSGLLVETISRNSLKSRDEKGLRVNDAKRPGAT